MKRIIYIDLPFTNKVGGDKNRSKYLAEFLHSETTKKDVSLDFILIDANSIDIKTLEKKYPKSNVYTIKTSKPSYLQPKAIFRFSKAEINRIKKILTQGKYDTVIGRMLSTINLLKVAEHTLKSAKIVLDVDMLFSRIAKMSWEQNKSIKNRYYYLEWKKLKKMEKKYFTRPYIYLFSSEYEIEIIKNKYSGLKNNVARYELFNNVAKDIKLVDSEKNADKKYILFYGTLNSAANVDAYKYMIESIAPKILNTLKETNTKIYVVGKNKLDIYEKLIPKEFNEYIKIIGETDDINKMIRASEFVFLPTATLR